MSDQEFNYDAFLSHASEDSEWCERLADRLRGEGVRVWFNKWELQPGDNLLARINQGLKQSRKMVAVFSRSYFRDGKVWTRAESFSQQHPDVLTKDRPLIPVLIEECEIEPTLRGILSLDFRNEFEMPFRQLVQALDLPRREFSDLYRDRDETRFHTGDRDIDPVERGRHNYTKGKRFEDELAKLYELLGWKITRDVLVSGLQIDLMIEKRDGGLLTQAVVECKNKRITTDERNQILAQQNIVVREAPRHRWIAVSSEGFSADARAALERAGIDCATYNELLNEIVPLDRYVESLRGEYADWVNDKKHWHGDRNRFIPPKLQADRMRDKMVRLLRPELTDEQVISTPVPALEYLGRWLGDKERNLLVILGDLGTGKSTLAQYVTDRLAEIYQSDSQRHPAPVLIPLRDVRKQTSLEGIVHAHFAKHGLSDLKFRHFEQLVRQGKVVLIFDAFDEMADRVNWDITIGNFTELTRCADLHGKVIITCRTHYFKDQKEQIKVIGEFRSSEIETTLYRSMGQRVDSDVIYLLEFDEEQIKAYIRRVCGAVKAGGYWHTIENTYNLEDLSKRPLLLDMIVKTLPELERRGGEIDTSELYRVYTDIWIKRDEAKGRLLDRETKEQLSIELAWRTYRDRRLEVGINYRELEDFLKPFFVEKILDFGGHELDEVSREMQTSSFLRRKDAAGNFVFMHKSFMEFFVARRLHDIFNDAGRRGDIFEMLDAPRYDKELVNFLAQLDRSDAIREPLRTILEAPYRRNVSENALQLLYWSGRCRVNMKDKIEDHAKLREALGARIPIKSQLVGAQLREVSLECIDLSNADLSGGDLSDTKLNHARLDGANLSNATLVNARFDNASLAAADFTEAVVEGASFNEAQLVGSDFSGVETHRASFVNVSLDGAKGITRPPTPRNMLIAIVRRGHEGAVLSVAYSPDGKLMASGGDDGLILLRRASDGKLLRVLAGHTGSVRSVAFARDGSTLASGSSDSSVRLWDLKSGKLLRALAGHTASVWSVAFAPDGATLASGSSDNSVRLWEVQSGKLLHVLAGHTGLVISVAFAPDGAKLASGSSDHSVRLWEVQSGKLLRALEGHTDSVRSVAFAPDGSTLASGSSDTSVRLWEVQSGKLLRALAGHTFAVLSVALARDGATLVSGSSDHSVRLWEVQSGKLLRAFAGHTAAVISVAFAPDGATLASGSYDTSVRLWEVQSGKLLRALAGRTAVVNSVALAHDGATLASDSSDHSVRLWEVKSGKLLRVLAGHTSAVCSVAFARDGATLASGSSDHSVRLWEVQSGKLLRALEGHAVFSVTFAPDGATLASGSSDHSVGLWEVQSGKLRRALAGHAASVFSVAFAPDGATLASGSSDHSVRWWEVQSGKLLRALEGHTDAVRSVAFAPDGATLASGSSDHSVRLWDVKSGKLLRALAGHTSAVRSVAFAHDGAMLASGSSDHSVRLWEVESKKCLMELRGNLGAVHAVAMAPNGKYLVAAGAAGRLQFWDTSTGETFLYIYDFGDGAHLALLPDGRFDGTPEGLRYLNFTEEGTDKLYEAEELAKEFYRPEDVRAVLEKYAT